MKESKKLIGEILQDVKRDMSDEEILALLAGSKISVSPAKESREKDTFGQRAADKIAKFAGSWAFIFSFIAVLLLWMGGNVLLASHDHELLQTTCNRVIEFQPFSGSANSTTFVRCN